MRRGLRVLRGKPRNRRGATMVLFALLLVPLLTIAALAIDVSQWQVNANQLQTVVDAAAIAAARAAQIYPPYASPTTGNYAGLYAGRVAAQNKVGASYGNVGSADLQPGWWDPVNTPHWTTRLWTQTYNAIQVSASATTGRIFSGILRGSGPTITRTATAWIANVNSGQCITPWGLPYYTLYNAAVAASGSGTTWTTTVTSSNEPPDLTQTQLYALSQPGNNYARTFALAYNTSGTIPSAPLSGNYQGYGYSGNNGQNNYQQSYWTCDNTNVTVGSQGGTTLSSAGNPECWTVLALQGSTSNQCQTNGGQAFNYMRTTGSTSQQSCFYNNTPTVSGTIATYNANCYTTSALSTVGPKRRVTWGDLVGNGSNAIKYREIGYVQLMCVFRGLSSAASGTANGAAGSGYTSTETCTANGHTWTDQAMGTIIVYVYGITNADITSGTVLGNTPGELQRIILVQ